MKKYLLLIVISFLPAAAWSYGEGEGIPMAARGLHLLTNQARCDSKAALAQCGAKCLPNESYPASMPPLYWHDRLFQLSQFYANLLASHECIQHETPCVLKPNFAQNYPQKCNGNAICACTGGKYACGDNKGTLVQRADGFFKLDKYQYGLDYTALGENLILTNDPRDIYRVFNLWLHEDGHVTNGHRKAIYEKDFNVVSVGTNNGMIVQNFSNIEKQFPKSPISSGAFYTKANDIIFGMHFYDKSLSVKRAAIVIGNQDCYELEQSAGTPNNGIFDGKLSRMKPIDPKKCTPFYFEAELNNSAVVRYPSTGSLLYGNCLNKTWQQAAPESCLGYVPPKPISPEPQLKSIKKASSK